MPFHDVVEVVRAVSIIGALPCRFIWAKGIVLRILMRSLSVLEPLEMEISEAIYTSHVKSRQFCPISSFETICAVHQLLLGFRFRDCIFTRIKKE